MTLTLLRFRDDDYIIENLDATGVKRALNQWEELPLSERSRSDGTRNMYQHLPTRGWVKIGF